MDPNHIQFVIKAHHNAFRKWDQKTPYSVHPLWCALTILTETKLSQNLRNNGSLALLYHDILEDTKEKLPKGLNKEVVHLVKEMTFSCGLTQEIKEIWTKEPKVKLLKLYDKVSNLLDSSWMSTSQKQEYLLLTKKLTKEVKKIFGQLNIVTIAQSLK